MNVVPSIKTALFIAIAVVAAIIIFLVAFSFFRRGGEEEIVREVLVHDPDSTVFLSQDGGVNWSGVKDIRFSVTTFAFTNDADMVYVATNGDGLWQSDTGGRKFELVEDTNGIVGAHATVFDVVLPASGTPDAYVAVFTNDKGRIVTLTEDTFTEVYFSPVTRTAVSALALDPVDDSRLFFLSDNGFFESRDAGSTWRAVHQFANLMERLLAHPWRPGVFWATSSRGELFYTVNYGAQWENISSRFRQFRGASENQNVFIDRTERLYMTSDEGLLTSIDAGVTWDVVPLIVPPDSLPITAFAAHPEDPRRLYVAANAQLYMSTDGGDSWQGRDFGGRRTIQVITIDPVNPERVLIGFDR